MQNFASAEQKHDDAIRDELRVAGIPATSSPAGTDEVKTRWSGLLGPFRFTRAWVYWRVEPRHPAGFGVPGMPLALATKLHNLPFAAEGTKYSGPAGLLGSVVRAGGHAGGIDPDSYVAHPVLSDGTWRKLLVYTPKQEALLSRLAGDDVLLCKEGDLPPPHTRYVDGYHIDSLSGLQAFAAFVREHWAPWEDWLLPQPLPTRDGIYRARLNGNELALIHVDTTHQTGRIVRRQLDRRTLYDSAPAPLSSFGGWVEWFSEAV